MRLRTHTLRALFFGLREARPQAPRRRRQLSLACDALEGRVTPAHLGFAHQAIAHLHNPALFSQNGGGSTTTTGTSGSTGSTSNAAPTTALTTLRNDVQTIELASNTKVGQLTAIRVAFQTLRNDGLSPSSASALSSFENSLVTTFASGTTLTGNSALLSQFEALYTSSPTAQQTADLTAAYDALAAAVSSSNITAANIATINTDWAAVQAAKGSTSTATYPYFSLVTGQAGVGRGHCG